MENKNWKRKFIALYTGQFFSLLSSAAVQFSIIWWLTDTTGSPLILALAGIAGFLPQALIGPFAGTIVDRHSRKLMMISADLIVALGSLFLFFSMYYSRPSITLVILVLVVRSLATAFSYAGNASLCSFACARRASYKGCRMAGTNGEFHDQYCACIRDVFCHALP